MGRTRLPRDDNNHAIPVLRFRTGGGQQFATNASNAVVSSAIAEGTRVVTLICSVNSYFESGGESITATANSHFIPAGLPYDMALGADLSDTDGYHRYVSVLTAGGTGIAYLSERE
jgi:hypothetical protein